MKLKITHVEGSKKGTVENVDAPVVTVGRDPQSTIVFDPVKDDRVSTKHATLSEQGGTIIVTDLGSRNGTIVNGQKISGPTPVPNGGLVQFGDQGPLIMVNFEQAAAAPAAAPAKKGGGGGAACAIILVLLLLLGAVGGGVAFFLLKGKHGGNPWGSVGVGSSYTTLTEMHMEKPAAFDSKTEVVYTLVSRTDDKAKVKIESKTGETAAPAIEQEFDLHPTGEQKGEKPLEEKNESVTVPAGTFSCHYTKTKTAEATAETWMSDDVPVAVKSVVTTDGGKTTMTLTKVDKK
ncbi:MAG TPA: FHA domain-containing protein [Planctomycetota bacterium]|nr:FHA domain-containing protein [Planctomycetota bacterium]